MRRTGREFKKNYTRELANSVNCTVYFIGHSAISHGYTLFGSFFFLNFPSEDNFFSTAGKKPQQAAEDGKVSEDLKSTRAQPESAQPTQPSDSSGKETVNLGKPF